ncbi:Pfs NACHT and ankyrin domain protein [Penicillium verhagenii]|uniref:Pfs NACHT and ankyrin domain protein n=1 Tax=Penicillium verhagenii TaxID=1562060 RepID=UPI0025453A9D|nr:Pfs NACHT and ankyrin domain protein [Penicillium verhagenii]KAJ5917589.1 Pfs NACHT and ankyrin domain protein [Penicillium verhagenii]
MASLHAINAKFSRFVDQRFLFSNKEGGYLERSTMGMYRSLLLQLLAECPDIQIILDDFAITSLSRGVCPSLSALKDLFCQAVFALGQRSLTCFIDALDECDEQEAVHIMQCFDDLSRISTATGGIFRVCLSGGDIPSISHRDRGQITLEDQPGHVKDLETYIERTLYADISAFVEETRPKLLDKAAGNFEWVISVVNDMNAEI